MKKKYKFNSNVKYLNTNGSLLYSNSILKSKIIELNIDFISHNIWKNNIDILEKQQQIINFKLKFNLYK